MSPPAPRSVNTPRRRPTNLPRSFIEHDRRRRAALGAAEIAHEFGIGEVTVSGICQVARMGRAGFYGIFDSIGDCLRFGFAEGFELIFAGIQKASEDTGPWPERLNAGLEEFYEAIAEEPLLAEFSLVHCFGAEQSKGHDYEAGVAALVTLIGSGRDAGRERGGKSYREPPPLSEEYLARMIISLAALRLRQGKAAELPEQRREMAMLVINTLCGADEAGRMWAEVEGEPNGP